MAHYHVGGNGLDKGSNFAVRGIFTNQLLAVTIQNDLLDSFQVCLPDQIPHHGSRHDCGRNSFS